MPARYRVEHDTRYQYSTSVATSQHLAFLCPRELPYQQLLDHTLWIAPEPAGSGRRLDYFGNVVDQFQILRPHAELDVRASSLVQVSLRPSIAFGASLEWEQVRTLAGRHDREIPIDVAQFVHASHYAPRSTALGAFAAPSFSPGTRLLDGAVDLMHRIHERFVFDPSATEVTTPLTRVLENDRGVCQDFAHLAIASLRSLGLPARYVSGYLLTDPPPGQPRLVGADASHAWFAVYCPANGWIDLDPTNDVVVGERHVTLAWGRDYGDIAPLRGVMLGGADHKLFVGVSVMPFEEVSAEG